MSWSEGRDVKTSERKASGDAKKLESIRQVNGVLRKLAHDEDLQDDLKLTNVRLAIDHWSGIVRMQPEKYKKVLENDLRVNSVYPKLKLLQSVCNDANIKVPIDHMLGGMEELEPYILTSSFGTDFCIAHGLTRPLTPKNPPTRTNNTDRLNPRDQEKLKFKESGDKKENDTSDGIRMKESLQKGSEPFSFWKIAVEAFSNADWMTLCIDMFKRQFLILMATLLVAYFMGFFSLEKFFPQK